MRECRRSIRAAHRPAWADLLLLAATPAAAARGDEANCLFNPDGCPHHGGK